MLSSVLVTFMASATAVLLPGAAASSMYLAERCRGGTCTDPKFPILDFDQDKGDCVCRAHPCWDNNGVGHKCTSSQFPFLHFTYKSDSSLQCSCSSVPQYDSLHVSRDHCAGEFCDSAEFPILDWNPAEKKCFCRAHPCWNQNGTKHQCSDPRWPILHYREDFTSDGGAAPVCECVAKLEQPSSGLRGSRAKFSQQNFGACTWSPHRRLPYNPNTF